MTSRRVLNDPRGYGAANRLPLEPDRRPRREPIGWKYAAGAALSLVVILNSSLFLSSREPWLIANCSITPVVLILASLVGGLWAGLRWLFWLGLAAFVFGQLALVVALQDEGPLAAYFIVLYMPLLAAATVTASVLLFTAMEEEE